MCKKKLPPESLSHFISCELPATAVSKSAANGAHKQKTGSLLLGCQAELTVHCLQSQACAYHIQDVFVVSGQAEAILDKPTLLTWRIM